MSHFGLSAPLDFPDTYSLLVLNISSNTRADELYSLFNKCGKVVDIFIPRDQRGSRGFAFVRYGYAEEAQKAVDKLDGKVVNGRKITVQFAKYGPNAERIHRGRRTREPVSRSRYQSRSPTRRDGSRGRDYDRRSPSRRYDDIDDCHCYRERETDNYSSRSSSHSPDDYYSSRGHARDGRGWSPNEKQGSCLCSIL